MSKNNKVPNPGSKEAEKLGCKCPVIDNHYGEGFKMVDDKVKNFWINGDCEVHKNEWK